jgi:ADP-heptose:LPS heptosyltransferase
MKNILVIKNDRLGKFAISLPALNLILNKYRIRILIGKNGKTKYFKLFNNKIISDYILSKALNIPGKFKFNWL